MAFKCIAVHRDGPVEHLQLNRPQVRNAFDAEMIRELSWWAESVGRDRDIRVVVISGAGPVFSAGADVKWMARTIEYTREQNVADACDASRLFLALDRLPLPVVGRVHGAALGGGAGLCAICDIVAAADDAVFGFSEVKLGIIPAVIAPFAIAKIGRSAARELFLTGKRFDARHAQTIGLVHAVAPAASLDEVVEGYIRELLSAGPEAIAAAKALIAELARRAPNDASSLTAEAIAARRVSAEGQEGLRAFLEKRPPSWATTMKNEKCKMKNER